MSDQRQPFSRFRLPWLASSKPTIPAEAQPDRVLDASRPVTSQAQRPPFRPAGVAPLPKAEPPPTPSRAISQTRGPPPSPNRLASRVSPQPQESPRASPKSPVLTKKETESFQEPRDEPLTRDETQTTASQPERNSPVLQKKEREVSQQPRDEPIKAEETQPPPQVLTPSSPLVEKVVESLVDEKKLPEASSEVAKEVYTPKQETNKQQPVKVVPEVVVDKKETRASHRPAIREKKEDSPKFAQKRENPNSIITLSGENTGAIMLLSTCDSSSKRDKKEVSEEDETMKYIYVNNNVQGINNSLLFDSSLSQRNPGVHLALTLSRSNSVEHVVNSGAEKRKVDARKSEVATTPTEQLAYEPNIRRRCLRGLLLESSDSEPEKPEKSRSHGCRAERNQKSKDGKIDVV